MLGTLSIATLMHQETKPFLCTTSEQYKDLLLNVSIKNKVEMNSLI